MKNVILIDIDTEREGKRILFGKPPDIEPPQTKEEAQQMVLNDIAWLSEAMCTLILLAAQNGYADKNALVDGTVKTITSILGIVDDVEVKSDSNELKEEA